MEVLGDRNGVAHLYRRIISPSLKLKNEKCQKQTHYRHSVYPYQAQVNHLKAASPVQSVVSAPGHLEARDVSLQPIIANTADDEALTKSEYAGYSFYPTVRFKTTCLPAMPLSRKYTPSPTGTTRSVAISYSHHMVTPSRFWANENPRILYNHQRDRIKLEEEAKAQCRRLKRTSEIVKHRIDKQYYMSGTKIPLQDRYEVDNTDLLRLKMLSQNKQLADYKTAEEMSGINPRESPSGQLSTPIPGRTGKVLSSDAMSSATEAESGAQDGKWAEQESDSSSIDEFDSVSMKGRREEFEARKALVLAEGKAQQGGNDGVSTEEKLQTPSGGKTSDKKTRGVKTREGLSAKGARKGKIRFREDGKGAQKTEKKRQQSVKISENEQGKGDNASETGERREEKRNKYLDEWLGIKREPEDPRYKPGKPPSNRILILAKLNDTKASPTFSSTFLTEVTEIRPPQDDEDMTPDARFGIINDKQRNAFGLLYDEVDRDKNGSVTLEELKLRMQPSVSKHDIHHFIQVFDLNKDKTVDKREFTAICALNDRLTGVRTESEDASLSLDLENLANHIVIFKEMFKTMDEDDDNRLDANELLEMVSAAMETEIGADFQLAKDVLEGARDEFGFIDFIGFLSYIPFFAKLLKTILEHPLSISELERARERVRQQDLTFKPKKPPKEPKSWEVF